MIIDIHHASVMEALIMKEESDFFLLYCWQQDASQIWDAGRFGGSDLSSMERVESGISR